MPGPMSLPDDDKRRYEELNDIVCDVHFHCDMAEFNKYGDVIYP